MSVQNSPEYYNVSTPQTNLTTSIKWSQVRYIYIWICAVNSFKYEQSPALLNPQVLFRSLRLTMSAA